MKELSTALRLWIDIMVAHLLLVIAKAGRSGEPNADVCYYLGDRCWRLADCYRRRGAGGKARKFQAEAEWYLRESGWWNGGPYGGALAMPIPKRPSFTAAVGRRSRQGPPDDAA
ncbi:MAG: hypothetical protein EXR70_01650 [Deltaproteobacteria bacterium]|nr:hypothetical protein [Deltaproteobacteria bacterium]